jgi:hypothetical protein
VIKRNVKWIFLLMVWNLHGKQNLKSWESWTTLQDYENLSLKKEIGMMFQRAWEWGSHWHGQNSGGCVLGMVLASKFSQLPCEKWCLSAAVRITNSNNRTEGRSYYCPVITENCFTCVGFCICEHLGIPALLLTEHFKQ